MPSEALLDFKSQGDTPLAKHSAQQSMGRLARLCWLRAGHLDTPSQSTASGQPTIRAQQTRTLRQASADSLDRVSNVFVDTAFRSTPWAQEAAESDSARTAARVLFVSESGVCRSVLAQALLRSALHARGLGDKVECEARGTRRALALGALSTGRQPSVLGRSAVYLRPAVRTGVQGIVNAQEPWQFIRTRHERNWRKRGILITLILHAKDKQKIENVLQLVVLLTGRLLVQLALRMSCLAWCMDAQ